MSGNVYLIGMPGSGKSRVGRELAAMLDMPFMDLDKDIEEQAGCSIEEIFRYQDETTFREMEKVALRRASELSGAVVACGGGVVLDAENRALMKSGGLVVWLNVSVKRLNERAPAGGRRPLLREPGDMERLLDEREPLYREVADRIIEGRDDASDMVRAVAEAVR